MTVVRNEFERGENSPRERARQADDGRGLRVAQLRQVDDRQPQRHRARADRQPAGLLSQLLPARQRRADRRRQVRRGEGPGVRRAILRRDSAARAEARHAPTPRSRRRTASGRSSCAASATWGIVAARLSHPGRVARGLRRRWKCWPASFRRRRRAGSTRRSSRRRRPARRSPAPTPGTIRACSMCIAEVAASDTVARRRPATSCSTTLDEVIAKRRDRRGSRAGQAELPQQPPAGGTQHQLARDRPEHAGWRMGDWRLYFLHRDRVEKVTPADVQRVAAKYLVHVEPHGRLLHSGRLRRTW